MAMESGVLFDAMRGSLSGDSVTRSRKMLGDLLGVFRDDEAYSSMDMETLVYEVEAYCPVGNIEGGLYFGVSRIFPGRVGEEFFMTRGHHHLVRNRAEYYWGISGAGILLLVNEGGVTREEIVKTGSLHYIAGNTAHRLINTGDETLVVGACWPSDAGHDYAAFCNG